MDDETNQEYQTYRLPEEFWVALLQLRNWLMQDEYAFSRVYQYDPSSQLRRSFDLVDDYLTIALDRRTNSQQV